MCMFITFVLGSVKSLKQQISEGIHLDEEKLKPPQTQL